MALEVVHRFPNGVVELDGGLRWDFDALFAEVLAGLDCRGHRGRRARANGSPASASTPGPWTTAWSTLPASLVAQPFSYRDDRSRAAVAPVHRKLDPARLYATTGLQFLQFNTIYQLATETDLTGCRPC